MKLPNHPQIEIAPISLPKRNPNGTIVFTDKLVELRAQMIRRHGFIPPILVSDDYTIVAGEDWYLAALKLNKAEVPVLRESFASDELRRAYSLADAKISSLTEFDQDALSVELEFFFEAGFDITELGFSTADLDFSVVEEVEPDKAGKAEEVELPDPDQIAVTRPRDLWLIGPHKAYCGDARDSASWDTLLASERADIVFGDAPYNVPINGHVSGTGRHREFAFASGEMSPAEFTHFLRSVFKNCVRFSRSGSIHYQCIDWRHIREILDAADGVYGEFKQLLVWDKGTGGMGTFYRSRHELVLAFKSGKAKHVNNFGLGETGRYRTNVIEYPGCNTFRKGREADLAAHSTVKPTAMVVDFLLDCSNRGDLVVDPFLGSGTTLIAAHKAKRRGAGMEIDPLYVDTALKRLQGVTGIEPVLAGDGRTFSEIAAERLSEREED
ncbi:DNA modification methylase [Qipengyuania oceanensis]|uniref:Methyltransferase n=1 Tax=Qipengyuania oceanensis TaxID=1463597 RepID=A0A844YJA6_9SPHN|nr:DNA modification methylase [Qipengyuania oceanensis]MXO63952.1 DNA methylase N-4 [Qipengyuania oceanensis]